MLCILKIYSAGLARISSFRLPRYFSGNMVIWEDFRQWKGKATILEFIIIRFIPRPNLVSTKNFLIFHLVFSRSCESHALSSLPLIYRCK